VVFVLLASLSVTAFAHEPMFTMNCEITVSGKKILAHQTFSAEIQHYYSNSKSSTGTALVLIPFVGKQRANYQRMFIYFHHEISAENPSYQVTLGDTLERDSDRTYSYGSGDAVESRMIEYPFAISSLVGRGFSMFVKKDGIENTIACVRPVETKE
jgi:hypothetical protein